MTDQRMSDEDWTAHMDAMGAVVADVHQLVAARVMAIDSGDADAAQEISDAAWDRLDGYSWRDLALMVMLAVFPAATEDADFYRDRLAATSTVADLEVAW